MYHITRCPNCRTSFRVTDAHLAAFDGKVRCGRCAFVFDATEHLVGDTGTPRPAPAPAPAPQVSAPPLPRMAEPVLVATPTPALAQSTEGEEKLYGLDSMASQLEAAAEAERDAADDTLASQSLAQLANALAQPPAASPAPGSDMLELDLDEIHRRLEHDPAPTPPASLASEIEVIEIPPVAGHDDFAGESFEHWPDELPPQAEAPAAPVAPPLPSAIPADEAMLDLSLPTEQLDAMPEKETAAARAVAEAGTGSYRPIMTAQDEAMLRVPERPSPWRWLWSIPALLALLGLVGQLTYHYRTEVAIQLPGIEPKLQRFCAMTGCELELPARAGYLRTEWNELVSLPEHPSLIQLNATLRNQAGFAQALPLLELTLTDDADRIVARKVFSAREYLAPLADGTPAPLPTSIAPNGELRVFLQLDLGEMHSSGYSLNWFYAEPN